MECGEVGVALLDDEGAEGQAEGDVVQGEGLGFRAGYDGGGYGDFGRRSHGRGLVPVGIYSYRSRSRSSLGGDVVGIGSASRWVRRVGGRAISVQLSDNYDLGRTRMLYTACGCSEGVGGDGDNIGPGQSPGRRCSWLCPASKAHSPTVSETCPPLASQRHQRGGRRVTDCRLGESERREYCSIMDEQRYGDRRNGVANIAYVRMYGWILRASVKRC